jgi:hypothetical protein
MCFATGFGLTDSRRQVICSKICTEEYNAVMLPFKTKYLILSALNIKSVKYYDFFNMQNINLL